MSKRLRGFSLIGGLIALAALFALNGCSNNAPMEPNLPQSADLSRLIGMGGSLELTQSVLDEAVIDADDGGVIDIERDVYLHQFEVPAGAIGEDTKITVESHKGKVGVKDAIIFDFGPDGLIFKEPANLKFQMAELNASALSANLYFFNARLNKWIYQASSRVSDGFAEFDIYHFSKYAISD